MDEPDDKTLEWVHRHPSKWFGTWRFDAAMLAFFMLGLIGPLRSSTPLAAVYFPGAFLAICLWSLLEKLEGWGGSGLRSKLSAIVLALYLIAATSTLFVASSMTGKTAYRNDGFISLVFTVPFGLAGIALIVFWERIPLRRNRVDGNSSEK